MVAIIDGNNRFNLLIKNIEKVYFFLKKIKVTK